MPTPRGRDLPEKTKTRDWKRSGRHSEASGQIKKPVIPGSEAGTVPACVLPRILRGLFSVGLGYGTLRPRKPKGNCIMNHLPHLSPVLLIALLASAMGCATTVDKNTPSPLEMATAENNMLRVQMADRTRALLDATDQLNTMEGDIDEQRRRLRNVCVDHPDHIACSLHQAAAFARETFCSDPEFTEHVDSVVASCQQGQCKQVDEAQLLSRTNYMTLVQRLPNSLVTFPLGSTRLDRKDKRQLQQFLENIEGDKGYIIVVGRASRDGSWKKNLRLALNRAEETRKFIVEDMGMDHERVGYITYGHEKMYITALDAERLSERKLSVRQANRSALVFSYPCHGKSAQ